jgi:release factor glutamine methyltransferase
LREVLVSRAPSPDVEADVVSRLRAAGCAFAEDEARLLVAEAPTPAELADLVDRRVAGEPLEQVLGWAEFCGLRISVTPGVFVPRRRTELLARRATDLAHEATRAARAARAARSGDDATEGRMPVVVDLCCGSGAVGVVVATNLPGVDLHAVDVDPAAVACTGRNVGQHGRVYQGDLYDPLPVALRGRVDVLVANAPYVPTDAIGLMPPEARDHEPAVALDGGADGLAVLRRVIAESHRWLAPGGHLLVETSEHQAEGTLAAFAESGLVPRLAVAEDVDAFVVTGALSFSSPHD